MMQGGCACGGVRYRIKTKPRNIVNCHCEPCRRITGHFMAATQVHVADIVLESEDSLVWYDPTPTVQYGFCGTCGSTLFWRAADQLDHLSIAAGTLDMPTGLTTTTALFGDAASDYHRLDDQLETLSGDAPPSDR